jgi:hypothetical protein
MAAFGYPSYTTGNTATNVWIQTSATTWPNQPIFVTPQSDWERAAVKAEPDDEFTWLRKRVREVEEMAFA